MVGVIGSLNVDYVSFVEDFPLEGETINSNSFNIYFGGKGANQAVASALAGGVETGILGKAKYNDIGISFINSLKDKGVNTTYIKESKLDMGNALILFSKKKKNNVIVINKLANNDYSDKDHRDVRKFIDKYKVIIFQNEINYDFLDYAIKYAKKAGKIVVFNPAPLANFRKEWIKYIDFLVPNETELSELTGLDESKYKESINIVKTWGAKDVLVTLGEKGVYVASSKNIVPAFKVNVQDTTAAGDTFIGVFSAMISQGKTIDEAVTRGNMSASITVQRKGAQNSIPSIKEVNNAYKI